MSFGVFFEGRGRGGREVSWYEVNVDLHYDVWIDVEDWNNALILFLLE